MLGKIHAWTSFAFYFGFCVGALAISSSTLSGAVITQQMSTTFATDFPGLPVGYFTFDQFDPAMGTITAVNFNYKGTYNASMTDPFPVDIYNTDPANEQTATVSSNDAMAFYITDNKGDLINNDLDIINAGPYTIDPLETMSVGFGAFSTDNPNILATFDTAVDMAPFVGATSVVLYGGITSHTWVTNNKQVVVSANRAGTTSSGTITLTYTYTPVPEPATGVVFLGIVAYVFIGSRPCRVAATKPG